MWGDIHFSDRLQLLGSEDKGGPDKELKGAADDWGMPEEKLHCPC